MAALTRTTDPKARLSLPKEFANATVIIEQISPTELRIRKAQVIPEDDIRFAEESSIRFSQRDYQRFVELLDNPPAPNAAARPRRPTGVPAS